MKRDALKLSLFTGSLLVGLSLIGGVGPSVTTAVAQSSDPYISAIDDRPAARLRRSREREEVIRPVIALPRPEGAPEMVLIQPGSFLMGSPIHQKQRDRNEGPQVRVNIDYAFEISRYEVTFDEWNACVNGGGCKGYRPGDNGWGRGKRPVTNISYNDAQSYIKWLNAKTGLTYRLPSEAEWEYVARAGQPFPFSTQAGQSISPRVANFNGEFPYGPNGQKGEYLRKTVPVGSYIANSFGVYDIHGNVYEFVSDCYVAGHAGNPGDGSPRRDGNCDARIIRGGSWVTHGYQMRAAKRLRYTMDHRYDDFGFRLARTFGPPPRANDSFRLDRPLQLNNPPPPNRSSMGPPPIRR